MRPPSTRRSTVRALTRAIAVVGFVLAALAQAQPATHEWRDLALVDARTGETFTLGGFVGKTVFVEPMATWCTSCRRQLGAVREAAALIDPERVVFIALSVETDLPRDALARYADTNGFAWTFAVMTPELLRALVHAFGRSVANPPATPHFIVRPDGTATPLATGHHAVEGLVARLAVATDP
jgi:thiol-disulfide isomerase/thioredoxin